MDFAWEWLLVRSSEDFLPLGTWAKPIHMHLDDSNIRNHEMFCYQIRIERKGIVKQRRQGNASRRRHIWHVHGYWNRDTMLAHGPELHYGVPRNLSFLLQLFVL